jgi:peptidyl-tRNA hydrolase, PTH1 family
VTSTEVWLVAGLGNPGPAYAGHRHNVGYLVADELASRLGSPFRAHKATRADVVEGRLGDPGTDAPRIVLARARCYMNESGGPLKALTTFYKVPADRLVVVHDELDLPFGTLRVKLGGGDNGHNGLRSLRSSLGTGDFYRVRIGIGRPPGRKDVSDHVLSDYSAAERRDVPFQVDRAADAVESLVVDGLAATQQTYNSPIT